MKRTIIIFALLWATTAGAKCWDYQGQKLCDELPVWVPEVIGLDVEWGYGMLRRCKYEEICKWEILDDDTEIGLREDGVVVWRKKP